MAGNVFLNQAQPSKFDKSPTALPDVDPSLRLVEKPDGVYLEIMLDSAWKTMATRSLVTTELLGKAKVPGLPFEKPDGSAYRQDVDYLGKKHDAANPFPGPFEAPKAGKQVLKVWPIASG